MERTSSLRLPARRASKSAGLTDEWWGGNDVNDGSEGPRHPPAMWRAKTGTPAARCGRSCGPRSMRTVRTDNLRLMARPVGLAVRGFVLAFAA